MKPLIGITTYYVRADELGKNRKRGLPDQDMLMSTMDYSRAIEKSGGIPITIPLINDVDYIDNIVDKCDGFLFAGGPDVSPINYGEYYQKGLGTINLARDKFEIALLDKALSKNKSILGICRGFQLINTFFEGTLYQDINNAKITDIEHVGLMGPKHGIAHKVFLNKECRIGQIFDKDEIMVNSFHHQCIKKLGKGLIECGYADNDIIEAFEHEDYSFVVGVQWHPEMMFEEHSEQLRLFELFLNSIQNLI
jgi:putative glutamine amidotransferase